MDNEKEGVGFIYVLFTQQLFKKVIPVLLKHTIYFTIPVPDNGVARDKNAAAPETHQYHRVAGDLRLERSVTI